MPTKIKFIIEKSLEKRVKTLEEMARKKCMTCDKNLRIGMGDDIKERFCNESCKKATYWKNRYNQLFSITEWHTGGAHFSNSNCRNDDGMCNECVESLRSHLKNKFRESKVVERVVEKKVFEEKSIKKSENDECRMNRMDTFFGAMVILGFLAFMYFLITTK